MISRLASADHLLWWCPGCEDAHLVPIQPAAPNGWGFDGDFERPSLTPSVLVHGVDPVPGSGFKGWPTCHSFVIRGRIEYLADSTHPLAGQTVPMVELPEHLTKE